MYSYTCIYIFISPSVNLALSIRYINSSEFFCVVFISKSDMKKFHALKPTYKKKKLTFPTGNYPNANHY